VRIAYTVNEKDFVEAQRLFRATVLSPSRRLGRQAMMFFGAFLLAGAIFLFASGRGRGDLPTVLSTGLCGAVLTGLYAFYPDVLARRKFRTDGKIRREMNVEFSEEGVRALAVGMESFSAWKNFAGYAESSGVFLLFLSPKLFLLFPKRSFDPADIPRFRHQLGEKLTPMKYFRNSAEKRP